MAWGLQGVIGKPGFLLSNLSNIGGGYRFSMVFLYIFPWFASRDDSHHLAQGEAELLLGRRLRPSSAPASSSTMDVNRDPTLQAVRGCGILGWLHHVTPEGLGWEVTGRKVVDVPVSNMGLGFDELCR